VTTRFLKSAQHEIKVDHLDGDPTRVVVSLADKWDVGAAVSGDDRTPALPFRGGSGVAVHCRTCLAALTLEV
jgi:hypothetical protein